MDTLDEADWQRTVIVVDRLAELGSAARMPLSRSLGDALFELRFTLGPTDRPPHHLPLYPRRPDRALDHLPQATQQRTPRDRPSPRRRRDVRSGEPLKETTMANYSRWDDVKKKRPSPTADARAEVEHDLALG